MFALACGAFDFVCCGFVLVLFWLYCDLGYLFGVLLVDGLLGVFGICIVCVFVLFFVWICDLALQVGLNSVFTWVVFMLNSCYFDCLFGHDSLCAYCCFASVVSLDSLGLLFSGCFICFLDWRWNMCLIDLLFGIWVSFAVCFALV